MYIILMLHVLTHKINHDSSVPTRARMDEEEGSTTGSGGVLCLTSGRSYSRGEEVFISYGNLSNLDTLVDYGFVAENNPCNSESISIQMIRKPPFTLSVLSEGSVDSSSMVTLRWYLANEEEMENFSSLEQGFGLGALTRPLSERNELDVQSFIASTLDGALFDAKAGAAEAGNDDLVRHYLNERSTLLNEGIQKITIES